VKQAGPASNKPLVFIVMPAYNAAPTLEATFQEIPDPFKENVLLVDDGSKDDTPNLARRLGIHTLIHIQNKGYGANQKTCYVEALSHGADIVVMLHPDNQYDGSRIPAIIEPILRGRADFVMGSRFLQEKRPFRSGMPVYKYLGNRFLTLAQNTTLGLGLSEYHSGFRAYSRSFLTSIPYLLNSDGFLFDSQVVAQCAAKGFHAAEIPVDTRYFPEASSIDFWVSSVYGIQTLRVLLQFLLYRVGLSKPRLFTLALKDVLSPEYARRIFRDQEDSNPR